MFKGKPGNPNVFGVVAGRPSRAPARAEESGISLLELVMAMGVMAVVLLLITASLVVTEQVRRFAEEKDTARQAMENEIARVRSLGFQGVLDEVVLLGPTRTRPFSIPGLDGGPAAPAGNVRYVTDETLTDAALGVPIGMPRDLDADGLATNLNTLTGTVTLVPVVASVTWTGVAGTRSLRTVVVMHRPRVVN